MKLVFALIFSSAFILFACDNKVDPDKEIHTSSSNKKNDADKIDGINTYGNDVDGRNSIKRDSNGFVQSNSDSVR